MIDPYAVICPYCEARPWHPCTRWNPLINRHVGDVAIHQKRRDFARWNTAVLRELAGTP